VAGLRLGAALRNQARGQGESDQRDGHVDPEDPLPAETVSENTAEEYAGGTG
jgi:hypothetical protein